ncbi:DUF3311 domain-containing protein [Natronorubrum sp. JWXQ-INN-674]|uniref:DUF3311 domain-containing protein n=1 Tax=Natronorubrum halalkaliphilum TaxID=2691917 RepID=A0A6B0VV47_9EURY|nr:DUF3311 domain-containing protein [Natronorubrum halalkaliphilum]MXV64479.1 DUF3311 domain-containing protein [Natronorubrum halalkaliphilum]
MRRLELAGWIVVAIVVSGLAIPWFLWGDATLVAGLPLWLWWHIGWMGLTSIVFWLFARRAWGIGIETNSGDSSPEQPPQSTTGGERP